MKIEYSKSFNLAASKKASETKVGEVFSGVIDKNGEIKLLLRAYKILVDLGDPLHTWPITESYPIIDDYVPRSVKIVVED